MSDLHATLPLDRFLPLPDHGQAHSANRRVGVEVEFAGLGVAQAAHIIMQTCGGSKSGQDTRDVQVSGTVLGDIRVELDIALKRQWAEDMATQLLGDLIPVEVITEPLPQADLPRVGQLLQTLVAAGAVGTQAKTAYGFGIHFNVELPADDGAALVMTARAFAICESWLRDADPPDPARRILPFIAPWPPSLVAELLAGKDWGPSELAQAMVTHAPSRHFGLDLLPALQHLCPDALSGIPALHLKGGRPAFHYRLPESRLGAPDWSLAYEWNRWAVIEHVATDPALLRTLAEAWAEYQTPLMTGGAWARRVEALITASDLPTRMGLTTRDTGKG